MSAVVYTFAWGNNSRRAELKDRECRIVARVAATVLIEFLDNGEQVTTSFRALRRSGEATPE